MNVHARPECEQEKAQLRSLIRRQLMQVLDGKQITCAGCGKDFPFHGVFRCYYCYLYFCRLCAKEHFGAPPQGADS